MAEAAQARENAQTMRFPSVMSRQLGPRSNYFFAIICSEAYSTCNQSVSRNVVPQMSGISFGNSGVRYSRRFTFMLLAISYFAEPLIRFGTRAVRLFLRANSRQHEAEFPSAKQTAFRLLQRALASVPARNRVQRSRRTLRSRDKRVNTKDPYGISFRRTGRPTFARRLRQTRRLSPAPQSRRHSAGQTGKATIALGEDRWLFRRQRRKQPGAAGAQWGDARAQNAATTAGGAFERAEAVA